MVHWLRPRSWWRRRAVCSSFVPSSGDGPLDELPVEPERPWGCGWFDSSLDLRQGLAVIEHQGIDFGLELMLRPDPGARPG